MALRSRTLSFADEAYTTNGGLLHISSVHGNEQIADGRSHKEHDSRILGFQPTCTFVSFVEETKLQVLVKEE